MRIKASAWIVGTVAAAGIATGAYYLSVPGRQSVPPSVSLATPSGVTLQAVGAGQGFAVDGRPPPSASLPFDVAFADARGMTLYTSDADMPGRSSCAGDCAKSWPPFVADAQAQPFGEWSVIQREDGTRQWAFKGRPLYTDEADKDPGSVGGNSPRPVKSGPKIDRPMPEGWHAALYKPAEGMILPRGIAVQDVADADGQALVDANGLTLYAFDGDANRDRPACTTRPCPNLWMPLPAPQIADPIGDFSFVVRDDGIKQWVYRGRALYRFSGDLAPGYANGDGVDPHWHVALLSRYFTPPAAGIRQTPGRGKVFATAAGLTLYRRVSSIGAAGHSFRHGVAIYPALAREIGTGGCDAQCLKVWHPFVAAADAQPSGHWNIVVRDDGVRQWTYRGAALYTYSGDKKPGDMTGNDIYDVMLSEDPGQAFNVDAVGVGAAALYWLIVEP